MRKFYLAYGSNCNKFQMASRCPYAIIVGEGVIRDYRLVFKGSKTGSYLTIEKHPNAFVPVLVWSITPSDEEWLDLYEGFPTFYHKEDFSLTIKTNFGKFLDITGFAYVMDKKCKYGIPSKEYFDACVEGYLHFGFSTDYLLMAKEVSNENLSKMQ